MTTRGKPLGGKYENIYEKTLTCGKRRYVVRIRFTNELGREATKTMPFGTLREAVAARDRFQAHRGSGNAGTEIKKKVVTMKEMADRILATKRHLRSFKDIQWIIAGEQGIVASFGPDLDLSGITELDIEWFKRDVLEKRHALLPPGARKHKGEAPKPLSNRTKNNYLLYLKCILRKAHRCGGLQMIPDISCTLSTTNGG